MSVLVLTRRWGDVIVLETRDGRITIYLNEPKRLEDRGDRAEVVIDAPPAVHILRGELVGLNRRPRPVR